MANKLVVFVVFAAVAVQASLPKSSSKLQSAKKTTLTDWNKAVDIVYAAIANPNSDLSSAKSQYLSVRTAGGKAFAEVAPGTASQNNKHYQTIGDLLFSSIATARKATPHNLARINAELEKSLNQSPVAEGVKTYWEMAKSKTSQTEAVAVLKQVPVSYWAAIRSLAAKKAGKAKSIDISSKSTAHSAITKFVNEIYGLLSKHG